MADLYCDHGAYGSTNQLAINTPAWGVPQEGDGRALAPSTVASTASILLNGQPTAGQVLSICGVTLTAAASGNGTTSFTIGGTLDATANNIAAVINACTTNGSSSVFVGTAVIQLKNAVYARGPSTGAPAATVQIMMRIGSSTLNASPTNQITSNFGTAPTITQWNGGESGCFGYLASEMTYSAITDVTSVGQIAQYGPFTGHLPHTGTALTAADVIWVRTGNSPTLSYTTGTSSHGTMSRTGPAQVAFDTNTKWTGDSPTGVVTFDILLQNTWSYTFNFGSGFGVSSHIRALRRGGLRFKITGTGSGKANFMLQGQSVYPYYEGIHFEDATTGISRINFDSGSISTPYTHVSLVNCLYERSVPQATLPALIVLPSINFGSMKYEGCKFKWYINGAGDPGALCSHAAVSGTGPYFTHFEDCEFETVGYSGGVTMFPAGTPSWATTTTAVAEIRFTNCTGLRFPTAFLGLLTSTTTYHQDAHMLYINLGNSGFRVENCRGVADWNPTDSPPTLGSMMPDGITPWSIRVLWNSLSILTPGTPFSAPDVRVYNRLSTGVRTVGVELALPNDVTLTDGHLRMRVSYYDSDGIPRLETAYGVQSSSATWTNQTGYTAKKIALTTQYPILTNSEVHIRLDLTGNSPTGSNFNMYVNPEPSIT